MDSIIKKVAYLQGLAEGQEIEDSKEGKIIVETVKLLADVIDELRGQIEELEDYVDILEQDLTDLEDYTYDEFEDDFDLDDYDLDDYDIDLYDSLDDYDDFDLCDEGCDCKECESDNLDDVE